LGKNRERNFRFLSIIPEKAGFENKFKSGFSGIFKTFLSSSGALK